MAEPTVPSSAFAHHTGIRQPHNARDCRGNYGIALRILYLVPRTEELTICLQQNNK
jgi:hypothetical protein